MVLMAPHVYNCLGVVSAARVYYPELYMSSVCLSRLPGARCIYGLFSLLQELQT